MSGSPPKRKLRWSMTRLCPPAAAVLFCTLLGLSGPALFKAVIQSQLQGPASAEARVDRALIQQSRAAAATATLVAAPLPLASTPAHGPPPPSPPRPSPPPPSPLPQPPGCQPDLEGSWRIGLFRGDSPLNLVPAEQAHPLAEGKAGVGSAANPIITCATVTSPTSNFVADPFLYRQPNGSWYVFFETKTVRNMQGDIGVAESSDGGASWHYLGLALDEPWHLSYPFVFQWNGQVYMVPECQGSRMLRLYRALDFPLRWTFVKPLVRRPLVDATLVEWDRRWWLFGSDHKKNGSRQNGELEIFYADSPLGPWQPHALNPVMNGDRRAGARMGGRVVPFEGKLLRFGQDCGVNYGHKVVAHRIDVLTPTEFQQTTVPFQFGQPPPDSGAWNSVRAHHVDAQQLADGSWVALMDGDSVTARSRRKPAQTQQLPPDALAIQPRSRQ